MGYIEYIIMFFGALILLKTIVHMFFGKETVPQQQIQTIEDTEVDDMILHDMNNDNDTWDIGVIDFNE